MATPTNASAAMAAESAPAAAVDMYNAANFDRYLDYFTDVEDGQKSVTLYAKFYGGAYRYVQGGTYGHTTQAPKLVEFALERTFGKTADWAKLPARLHEDHVNRQREFEQRRSGKNKNKSGGNPNKPGSNAAGPQGQPPRPVNDVALKREYNRGWADGTRDGRKAAIEELKITAEIADAHRRALEYFATGAHPDYYIEVAGAVVVFVRPSEYSHWTRADFEQRRAEEASPRKREREEQHQRDYAAAARDIPGFTNGSPPKRPRPDEPRGGSPTPSTSSTVAGLAQATQGLSTAEDGEMEE